MAGRGPGEARFPRAAALAGSLASLLLLVHQGVLAVLWFGPPFFGRGPGTEPQRWLLPWAAVHLLALLTGAWALLAPRRLPRGTRGRGRLLALGWALLLGGVAGGAAGGLVLGVAAEALRQGFVPVLQHAEVFLAAPPWVATASAVLAGLAGVAALAQLVLLGALWMLVPAPLRARIWLALDVPLAAATLSMGWWLPALLPEPEAARGARLLLVGLLSARAFARLLPAALSGIEALGFRSLVAARHLRARKSGFLATISVLSIAAVALSNSSLVTTLSVMGGFRHDLKRKILDHNAHLRVESEDGAPFEGWEPLLRRLESVDGVLGAQPVVQGEVMATSATNLAGAVLRGIDPERAARATRLAEQIESGSLHFLAHPEQLKVERVDLDADATGLGALDVLDEIVGERRGSEKDEGTKPRALDPAALLAPPRKEPGGAEEGGGASGEPSLSRLERLPGVVVGRELARALRLFVGDELQVVTPFGELGPAGPMPRTRSFRVVGIFYSGMYEYDMKHLYVLLPEAQRLLGLGEAVTALEARVREVERAPEVAAAARAALGREGLVVRDWQQLNRNLFGALALEKLAMFVTLGIAVLVAGFCIFGTLTLMVQEKRRDVAILQAMGASDVDVRRLFLLEGLLIGAIGTAAGLGLGYLLCYAAERFGVRMNPEVYYIDRLPVHVDPAEFAAVGAASLLVAVAATWVPASLAARLRPVEALRHE